MAAAGTEVVMLLLGAMRGEGQGETLRSDCCLLGQL